MAMIARSRRDSIARESQGDIELSHISPSNRVQGTHTSDIINNENGSRIEQQLKPADGGLAAWMVLLSAFMFEALLWGEPAIDQAQAYHRCISFVDS